MWASVVSILSFLVGLLVAWMFFPQPAYFADWYGRDRNSVVVIGALIAIAVIVFLVAFFTW